MNVSAASLAPDSSVRKATPSDITERTARSGAVVETIFLSRPRRAQCRMYSACTQHVLLLLVILVQHKITSITFNVLQRFALVMYPFAVHQDKPHRLEQLKSSAMKDTEQGLLTYLSTDDGNVSVSLSSHFKHIKCMHYYTANSHLHLSI